MAHMWRARKCWPRVLPSFVDERERMHRRAYRTSTPRTRVTEGEIPGDLSYRLLVRRSEIFDRAFERTGDSFLDVSASHRRSSVRAERLHAATYGRMRTNICDLFLYICDSLESANYKQSVVDRLACRRQERHRALLSARFRGDYCCVAPSCVASERAKPELLARPYDGRRRARVARHARATERTKLPG